MSTSPSNDFPAAAAVALIAGLLIAVGAFLPWISATSGFGSVSRSGMEGPDGLLAVGAGVVAAVSGLAGLSSARPKAAGVGPLIGGIVGGFIALANYLDVADRVSGINTEFGEFGFASVGAGIWTIGLGALLALFAGIGMLRGPTGTVPSATSSVSTRECPHCREQMRRDASVCPHCQRESTAWRFHEGRWWYRDSDANDYWLNESSNQWEKYSTPKTTPSS